VLCFYFSPPQKTSADYAKTWIFWQNPRFTETKFSLKMINDLPKIEQAGLSGKSLKSEGTSGKARVTSAFGKRQVSK
jgi:hypothetical protein